MLYHPKGPVSQLIVRSDEYDAPVSQMTINIFATPHNINFRSSPTIESILPHSKTNKPQNSQLINSNHIMAILSKTLGLVAVALLR